MPICTARSSTIGKPTNHCLLTRKRCEIRHQITSSVTDGFEDQLTILALMKDALDAIRSARMIGRYMQSEDLDARYSAYRLSRASSSVLSAIRIVSLVRGKRSTHYQKIFSSRVEIPHPFGSVQDQQAVTTMTMLDRLGHLGAWVE